MAVSKHFHLYYCAWLNESRAWKMGQTALRHGLANLVFYFGYKVEGLSECENFADNQYWSSSEVSFGMYTHAWYQFFTDGGQGPEGKNYQKGVRAIRSF